MGKSVDESMEKRIEEKIEKTKKESMEENRISVRNLVEFILRHGDIDNRHQGAPEQAMQEGGRIHRMIQRGMGAEYQAEVTLRYTHPTENYVLVVEGRADGIIHHEGQVIVDEIKGTYRDVNKMKEPLKLHLAQAKCYAYICALQEELQEIRVRMTYCNMETEELRYFYEDYAFPELEQWFQELIAEYQRWADYAYQWKHIRQESIQGLSFPFPYREGQKELVASVYRTIYHKKKLFLEAPTGVGKTISTIYPAVQAMGQGMAEKLFYLTAKTITRTVAEDTFTLLREKGLHLKSVILTAKEKVCFMEQTECNPENCPYAKGHYDRINEALFDLLTSKESFSRETIEAYAQKHQVCPFEMCLDISLFSDAVICDYNYLFDPDVYLKRFFGEGNGGSYVFLIDEAHNLLERGREMYSASLYKEEFLELRSVLKRTILSETSKSRKKEGIAGQMTLEGVFGTKEALFQIEKEQQKEEKTENKEIENEETENEKIEYEEADYEEIADEEADYEEIADEETENKKIEDEEAKNEKIADEEAENKKIQDEETEALKTARKSSRLHGGRSILVRQGYAEKMVYHLEKCNQELLSMKRDCDGWRTVESVDKLMKPLMRLYAVMEEYLAEQEEEPLEIKEKLLDFYFEVRHFLEIYELVDENYVKYTQLGEGGNFLVKLFCVNPSENLKNCMAKGRSTILFSATFLPIQYYKKLLGGEQEDYEVYAKSVFRQEKKALFIAGDVTSKYTRRSDAEYYNIACYIDRIVSQRHGNYMVFCPSYAFLRTVYNIYRENFETGEKYCILQQETMSEREREEFLDRFRKNRETEEQDTTLIGFCVLGGVFGEGIDLKKDSLIGAMIVGTGLPQVCCEREILKWYFEEAGENGFDYSYRYPGMNKVLQAAGRVIRTVEDVGIVALLDERFLQLTYQKLFPREWEQYEKVTVETVAKRVERFWDEWL